MGLKEGLKSKFQLPAPKLVLHVPAHCQLSNEGTGTAMAEPGNPRCNVPLLCLSQASIFNLPEQYVLTFKSYYCFPSISAECANKVN